MNTSELKKYYIKMIQTLKHNYFVDDECRKIYLQAQFGKDSLKELSIEELRVVLEVVGYKPHKGANFKKSTRKTKTSKTSSSSLMSSEDLTPAKGSLYATKKQLETIAGIWEEIANVKTGMALREFIFRIVKIRPLHLKFLSRSDAADVVQALIQMKDKYYK
ncbi:phage protein GemA/Gp16 family protein [uncultured Campylobacter sp.]|uniref:phage protein GemA/Gp16 family protein n=1 Tax=uncultured Campylobacter sp. TaxID=218934 RepID=UPI0028F0A206|nr:phage protein GemA/Gp16 family protein [uncultured Campylobacter sp.]